MCSEAMLKWYCLNRSLRKKNEAKSKNNQTDARAALARSHTTDREKLDKLLTATKEMRTRRRSVKQQSESRNSSKSPSVSTSNPSAVKETAYHSMDASINDENLENSFNKSIDRENSCSSKKTSEKKTKAATSGGKSLLSTVYAVKKQNFSKISPLRKGRWYFHRLFA